MAVCSWILDLPSPTDWLESDSQLTLQLASSKEKTILLNAERTSGSNTEALVTFSISLHGFFHPSANPNKTLWVSNPCQLASTQKPVSLALLHQLVQETIARAPTVQDSTIAPFELDPETMSRAFGSSWPEPSFSRFFNLAFLCRLFWLCVCDAPAEAGSLFFEALAPSLDTFIKCKPAMSAFVAAVGAYGELLFMRALGYMLAKWCILREVGDVSPSPKDNRHLGFSYAREFHGLWVLKGYAPIQAMSVSRVNGQRDYNGIFDAKGAVLKYALAHQQLEAVIQLEYSARYHAEYIRVGVRLDNLRIHVRRLGFGGGPDEHEQPFANERHHPTRVRVWVGPESGLSCPSSLTLGRSTENPETEVEMFKSVRGNFGKSKSSKAKATVRSATRVKTRDWRWEQDADGNAAVFEGVLCNYERGAKLATTWQAGVGWNGEASPRGRVGKKSNGGLVFAGDECGEEVSWRMGREEVMREMDGGDLKWRLGGKVWLSYWPGDFETSYYESRCVEWCEEVKLPLACGK